MLMYIALCGVWAAGAAVVLALVYAEGERE